MSHCEDDSICPPPASVTAARDRIGRARTLTPGEVTLAPIDTRPTIERSGFRLAESEIGRYVASFVTERSKR